MSKKWIWLRIVQIILDTLGVYGSFVLAYFLRVGGIFSTDFPFELFAVLSAAATVVWLGFLGLSKYYRIPPRSGVRAGYEVVLAIAGGAVAIGFLIVSYFFPRDILFSRWIAVTAFGVGVLWLLMTREIFRWLLAKQKKSSKNVYKLLVVGANRVAEQLIDAINADRFAPYQVVGVIDPYGLSKKIRGSRILGKLDQLDPVCKKEGVTSIIQCDAFEHTLNLISFSDEHNIKFQFDPALRGIFEKNLRIRDVAGQTMISFVQRDYTGVRRKKFQLIDWVLRQVFDVD